MQLHLLDDCRAVALRDRRRRRQRSIQRPRRQQPPEHAVVGQPRRIGRQHLGVERHLATRRLVALPEQRVAAAAPPAPRPRNPVALALKRVAGHRDAAPLLAREQRLVAQRETRCVGPGDRGRERRLHLFRWRVAPRTPQAGHDRGGAGGRRRRPRQCRHRPQHRVRTDLHQRLHAEPGQRLHRLPELHLLARVAAPVRCIGDAARLHQAAAQVAHQGNRRRCEGDPRQRCFQIIQRRLHQRAVIGGAVAQQPHPYLLRLEPLQQRRHVVRRAADHLVRAVVHGQAQPHSGGGHVVLLHRRRHPLRRREHHRHRPRLRQRPDQRPAGGRKAEPVLQAEHARGLGSGDLAQAVPDHHVRADPQARPQRRQRALQRVDGRLLPLRLVQITGRVGVPEHHRQQRGAAFGAQQRFAAVQHRPHHRLAGIQCLAHPSPLARLSGEGKCHLRLGLRARRRDRGRVRLGQGAQTIAQRIRVTEHHSRAAGEVAAPGRRRPRQVGQRLVGRAAAPVQFRVMVVEPAQVFPRQVAHRFRRLARQRQEPARPECESDSGRRHLGDPLGQRHGDPARRPCGPVRLVDARADAVGGRVAFQHHVGVGAGPAEAAHPRQRRMLGMPRPFRGLRGDPQGQPLPVHLRARVAEVQVRGNDPLPHRQHHLHHAGNPRRRFQVADVGLHRANQQRPVGWAPAAVDRPGGVGFDRVAHLGAGAVRLHVVHVSRLDAGPLQRRLDHPLLRRAAGHGQARARAVLVQSRGADNRPDPIAVRLRLGQTFQHHDAAALAPYVAVGGGIERLAASVRRQHAGVGAQLQQPS